MKFTTKTPHVEQDWAADFVLALRLRDVPGAAIGAALAEVDAHCADAGEGAREAFGDPTAYADSLEFSAPGEQPTPPNSRRLIGTSLFAGLGMLGMLATLWGDDGLRHDRGVAITVGMLVALGVLLACFAGTILAFDRVVPLIARRPFATWLLLMGFIGVSVLCLVLLPTQLFVVPALPTLGVGLGMLLVSSLAQYRDARTSADPVTGPAEAGGIGGDARPQSARSSALMAALLMPVLTLLLLGMNRLLGL